MTLVPSGRLQVLIIQFLSGGVILYMICNKIADCCSIVLFNGKDEGKLQTQTATVSFGSPLVYVGIGLLQFSCGQPLCSCRIFAVLYPSHH